MDERRTEADMKEKLTDFGLLWLRVFVGAGLMYAGWMKLTTFGVAEFASKGVEPLGFPMPIVFAWLAVLSELIGGFFLVLGLWTRIAAIFAGTVVGVAFFGTHAADPFAKKQLALAYLVVVIALFIMGAGRFAVDGRGKGGGKSKIPKSKSK
jgi:putative oxidoreductase